MVERATILSTGAVLQIDMSEADTGEAASRTDLTAVERTHILQVLHDTAWRVRGAHGAAARLGLKPTTLQSRMKKPGLTPHAKAQRRGRGPGLTAPLRG